VTRLTAAAAVLVALATLVAASAPADLVASPVRPFADNGSSAVRTSSLAFPREAIGADDERVRVDRPPVRIVSTDAQVDEFLAALVQPTRIVGVSAAAFEPAVSNLLGLVRQQQPIMATSVEAMLMARPDLVISPMSAPADQVGLLRRAHVPVYRLFTRFSALQEIEAQIRLIGYLTGEDARAEAEATRFHAAVRAASARRRGGAVPRVLGLGGVYTYGRRTLFADIARELGVENVAATHGLIGYDRISPEQIIRWDPDWIVAGAAPGQEAVVRAQLLRQPAIAATRAADRGQILVLDNRVFLPLSPYTTQLVERLADALFGAAR